MDTQLGASIDGGPRRFTEVVLNEQSLPVAWWSHDGREYYSGKEDHHKRVTTERPHPTGGSCPREGHSAAEPQKDS